MKQSVFFMPHPPIIMEEIGGDQTELARCTVEGMTLLAKKIGEIQPDTIIYVSPHGNGFSNGTNILYDPRLMGDFKQFGNDNVSFAKITNQILASMINEALEEADIISMLMDTKVAASYNIECKLDHGVMVPMYFIDKYVTGYTIVHMTPGFTSLEENYQIGTIIKDVVNKYTKGNMGKVVIVASGDLSHALSNSGPYAYHEAGPQFDAIIRKSIEDVDPLALIKLEPSFIEDAAQCGIRSYLIGLGYLDGLQVASKVISYEGPFGVGYLTGYVECDYDEEKVKNKEHLKDSHMASIKRFLSKQYNERLGQEDDYIRLARLSIENYVNTSTKLVVDENVFKEGFIDELECKKSGAFVSVHKEGKLRGCIGTIESSCDHLLDEIIYNSISACSADPRFHPIEKDELPFLDIKVDILFPYEPIHSPNELDVKCYGVIVEQGYKRGLLLPNLEGVDSVSEQIRIAKQKASITSGEYKMYRFKVERHEIK